MKILLSIPSITSYHTFLHTLCGRLLEHGHEVHLAASPAHLDAVHCYESHLNCKLHPLSFPRGGNILAHGRAAVRLRELVRQIRPDLIHLNFSACAFTARLARQTSWAHVALTVHGLRFPLLKGIPKLVSRTAELWAYKCANSLWVLNEEDVQTLERKGFAGRVERLRSFGLGCDLSRFDRDCIGEEARTLLRQQLGIGENDFVIAFIGRQVEFKGFGATVRAFFSVHQNVPSVKLLLVGVPDTLHGTGLTTDEESWLARHPSVIRVGWQANVEKYLSIAHLNVFPSRREGIPVNLMESLAMGVPVVTINSRGCGKVVRHDVDGIVLANARVELIASAIEQLFRDQERLRQFASNALLGRDRFDQEVYFREQIGLYEAISHSTPSRAGSSDSKRPRISFVVSEDWYFFSHRIQLAKEMVSQGWDVSLLTNWTGRLSPRQLVGIKTLIIPISRRSHLQLRSDLSYFLRLLYQLLKLRPQLLHLVALKPSLFGSVVAILLPSSRVICTFAGMGFLYSSSSSLGKRCGRRLVQGLFKWCFKFRKFSIIAQNRENYELLRGEMKVPPDRLHLVAGVGTDLHLFSPRPRTGGERVRVIMASRLLIEKGVRDYFAASKILQKRNVDVIMLLAGSPDDDPVRSVTLSEIASWKAEGVLRVLGHVEKIHSLLPRCDIAVFPSYYSEGLPKFLLEAAACGLPIVTTDNVGCRDVVTDGSNGILVPPKNPDALADAIECLAQDEQMRIRFGRESRRIAEQRFDSRQYVGRMVEIYEKAISAYPSFKSHTI